MRGFAALLKDAGDEWVEDDIPSLSASLAFYTILSLIPFMIVVCAIGARLYGERAAEGQLMWEIRDVTGDTGAQAIQELIRAAQQSTTTATIIGSVTLAFSASAVVMELRDALDRIWDVPLGAGFSSFAGFLCLLRKRFYLFGLILGAGVLLIASLAFSTMPSIPHLAAFGLSFTVVTILFAAIYKLVPEVKLDWKDVIVGACFTSFLFSAGKQLIGFYLGHVSYSSTYGTAGSILIILVWVYYSAQLFFFGAEFTRVYAKNARQRTDNAGLVARASTGKTKPLPISKGGSV